MCIRDSIEAMREAADYMIGPKNFTSFTDDSENKDPVRRAVSYTHLDVYKRQTWHLVDIINGLSLPEQIRTG